MPALSWRFALRDCALKLTNAGGASYAKGWEGCRAVASYDRRSWFRVPTTYDGTTLAIRHAPTHDAVYYAYFAPYSMERHNDLIAQALASPQVRLEVLGATLDGQDLDLLRIGEPAAGKRACWVIGRQHPGETMAEWWMEGFLQRLLDGADPVARELLKRAVFNVVPNMNPDGSRRGHLRTNAAGANLNREWASPSLERSPEVFLVRQAMAAEPSIRRICATPTALPRFASAMAFPIVFRLTANGWPQWFRASRSN